MTTTRIIQSLSSLLLLCLLSFNSHAGVPINFGPYIIHYNAINTEILDRTVAKSYGIKRSKYRGMMNIAVIKKTAGTIGVPVEATITAYARNLNGQIHPLELRELHEQGAIYYIAEFTVQQHEVLNFVINVTPEKTGPSIPINFSQQFFTD
ncbi:MAG: DUF4426 domain-containing protein [Gammaproteobacteria bacterium]|nr:DUF4426 domain-containing protein [Gammaproteobacteria bacterium]